jgi:hypothetical protein
MTDNHGARGIAIAPNRSRPRSVTALSLFFALGSAMALLSLVALLFPGTLLEPMWDLNPRAREQFAVMGPSALLLMAVVSAVCALASYGLWQGKRFGFILGLTLLAASLMGDLANATLGLEPRAWIGVPISAALLVMLATGRARAYFSPAPHTQANALQSGGHSS